MNGTLSNVFAYHRMRLPQNNRVLSRDPGSPLAPTSLDELNKIYQTVPLEHVCPTKPGIGSRNTQNPRQTASQRAVHLHLRRYFALVVLYFLTFLCFSRLEGKLTCVTFFADIDFCDPRPAIVTSSADD